MGKYNNKVVVVIPIHSQNPSDLELISFQQCFKVLHKHDIKVIAPEGLSLVEYRKVVKDFDVIFIDKIWQSSIEMYNKLKVSQFFYHLFMNYQYLLTYELDAFVFKDDLLFWCNKGYDFIGAPWFVGYNKPTDEFLGVGNSGFSLRNINSFKRAIRQIYLRESSNYLFGTSNKFLMKMSVVLTFFLRFIGENDTIQKASHINEDLFVSKVMSKKVKGFNLAPIEEARQFSFEVNPRLLYGMNGNKLPMGCHAWWQYDLNFWKPFITKFGYEIDGGGDV